MRIKPLTRILVILGFFSIASAQAKKPKEPELKILGKISLVENLDEFKSSLFSENKTQELTMAPS